MKYNPHTGCVVGETKTAHITAAIKATKDGITITHLSITSKRPDRDVNSVVIQSIKLAEIRRAYREWLTNRR